VKSPLPEERRSHQHRGGSLKSRVCRVGYVFDFGAGIYTFLKFPGGSNVLLTQRKGIF
jgi:hypothetical protein